MISFPAYAGLDQAVMQRAMEPTATNADRRAAYIMAGAPGVDQAYGGMFVSPSPVALAPMAMQTTETIVMPPPTYHAINMPPIAPTDQPHLGKGGIPGGAYSPSRHGFGLYPPVRADITDRIFGHCCPQRLRMSAWWTPSYIADYLLLILIWVAVGIMWFWYDGYDREYHVPPPAPNGVGFAWYDNMFTYPFDNDEAISVAASAVLSFVVPVVVFLIFAICRRSAHDFHHAMLGLGEAIGIGYIIQIPITRATGIFRPDFLDRVLSGDHDKITDGRRSFPSGHAMIAFCGYAYLTFYFMGKTKVFHAAYGNLWRIVLCFAPIAAAVAQSITRIRDNRHHPVDIVGGAFIGIGTAIICYLAQFPGFSNRFCARPKNRKARMEGDWSGMIVDY